MLKKTEQSDIKFQGAKHNKVVGGDDNSQNTFITPKNGKLSSLFEKLKTSFDNQEEIERISEDLKRYTTRRDTIGLEQKLKDGGVESYYQDFAWFKQEFFKKLVYYQNYEPAQEIFAYILAIVLEKYINIIKPMLRNKETELNVMNAISNQIVNPILNLIEAEGCDDIIGLSSTEIQGMFHYLTGNCHINWKV